MRLRRFRTLFITSGLVLLYVLGQSAYQNYRLRAGQDKSPFTEEFFRALPGEKLNSPLYANCPHPHAGKIKFKGRTIVHERFVQRLELKKNPVLAVQKQLEFLVGYFNHGTPRDFPLLRVFSLKNDKDQIRILKTNSVRYGRKLEIDFLTDSSKVYPPELFQPGKTWQVLADDPALAIDYEAEQSVITCSQDRQAAMVIDIELPPDPYLAFWSVPLYQRETLHYGRSTLKTNPCADAEIADIAFPSMYWYVWNPNAKAKSYDGHAFDCHEILKIGRDDFKIQSSFMLDDPPQTPLDFDSLSKLAEWDMRVIYGLVSQTASRKSLDEALKLFRSQPDLLASARVGIETLNGERFLSQDQAVWSFFYFLNALSSIADLEKPEILDQQTNLLIRLQGVLKVSKKKLKTEIYFGSTDEPQGKAKHWSFLKDALHEAPLIFYVGHAGMGKNLDFDIFKKQIGLSDGDFQNLFSAQPYQLFGIVSCFANVYYNDVYKKLRVGPGLTTDVLLTAQGGYPFLTPVSVLYFLDLKIAGHEPSLERALQFGIGPHDMNYYRRFAGDSGPKKTAN